MFFMFLNGLIMATIINKLDVDHKPIVELLTYPYYWTGALVSTNAEYFIAKLWTYE
jgi:hypothetical protein